VVSAVIQQHCDHVFMTLLASDVKCCVEVLGRSIRRCPVLQQQYHVVGVTESSGDVQRSLLLLTTRPLQALTL